MLVSLFFDKMFQSSFLDKYLSESESDEGEQQESKEREMSTKGNKR